MRCGDADPVALLLDHGASAPAAMLAVLKAGKAYLVLDSSYPLDRLTYMLADSGASLVITDTKNLPLVARLVHGKLSAMSVDEVDENLSGDNLDAYPPPGALAMLIYTSGSTGSPKGVMHSHRNVLVEVRNITNEWGVGPHDRWLLYTSLSFANSVRTIYCALLNGGAIYPYDLKRRGFGELADWLRSQRITIFRTLPTTFRNFMASLPPDELFPDIRVLSIGGEPMYRGDVEAFNRHFAPSCVIAHGLGPTECFIVCFYYVAHGARVEGSKLDIGWSVRDKEMFLLDDAGKEPPVGEVGEIHVRSHHVALGYWRDADRTRAAFVQDPDNPAVRTYRVPFAFTFVATALPMVRNGQLKAIAVTSRERSSVAPDIPTLHESGLPEFQALAWYGLLAPAGTPPEIVVRLNEELARMVKDPDVETRLRGMGFTPVSSTPAKFADELKQETRRWAAIVKVADLRLE